jgi:hypothetical protein
MWAGRDNIPFRQIARIIVNYRTDALRTTLPLVNNDLTTTILLMGVVKARLILSRETAGHEARITASAIARSFNRPHQTMHRHAEALVRLGFCVKRGHRIDVTDHPALTPWLGKLRDRAVQAIEQWRQSGIVLPKTMENGVGDLTREIGIFALAMSLSAVEYHARENDNWIEMFITGALLRHNVEAITDEFPEQQHFGVDIPPLESRKPMPMGDLAAALAMPYSTLARHVCSLIERGQVARMDNGLIVSPDWLCRPDIVARMIDSAKYVGRRMIPLQTHGFDFAVPMRHHR